MPMHILPTVDDRPIGKSTLFVLVGQIILIAIGGALWYSRVENRFDATITRTEFFEQTQKLADKQSEVAATLAHKQEETANLLADQLTDTTNRVNAIEKSRLERSAENKTQVAGIQEQTRVIPTLVYRVEKLEAAVSDVGPALNDLSKSIGVLGTKLEVLGNKVDMLANERRSLLEQPKIPLKPYFDRGGGTLTQR